MGTTGVSTITRWLLLAALACLAVVAAACGAGAGDAASSYPARTVQVIVPYPAGSGIDTTTRALVDIINKRGTLGQRLQVVNKEGGEGVVGTSAILSAKPDGYTIGVVPDGPLTLVPQTQHVSYDPDQLTVINEPIVSPIMFVVPGNSHYSDLDELISSAKENPGQITIAEGPLNYAVPADMVESATGAKFKHVKYDGDAATTTALLGDNVDVGVMQLASALPQLSSGKLRALAITASDPVALVPDVPTFASQGIDLVWEAYNDVIAPDGVPEAVADKLEKAFSAAVKSSQFADAAKKLGLIVSGAGPEEALQHLKDKTKNSGPILKAQQ